MTDVVDRVLAALNEQELDAFLAGTTPDATIGNGLEEIRASGHNEFRALYGAMFERYPNLQIEAGWKTAVGEFVVQEETVTGRGGHERHVAVYLLVDGVIARERIIA